MTFNKLDIKKSYDSDEDNIVRDFYIPVLSEAVSYKRIAGYFSSTSFVVAARGLTRLISNNGFMKLIINVGLSKSDFEAIESGLKNPENIISELLIKDFMCLENEFVKNHVKVLAWMVAKNLIEIKVSLSEDSVSTAIFHQKVGILQDKVGNIISFSGSDNESANGWVHNIEEFKVFRSWISEEKDFIDSDLRKFDKFWNNQGVRTRTYDFPTAIKEKLLEISPDSESSFEHLKKIIEKAAQTKEPRLLRDYQTTAIANWKTNNFSGILEMATGTGKTFTAICAIKEMIADYSPIICVIVVPYQHLVTQWSQELMEEEVDNIKIFGSNSTWKDKLMNSILDINMNNTQKLVIVTTYDTFSSDLFINTIRTCKSKKMIVGDEVHTVGSDKRRNGLVQDYNYRLGLSATPNRWLDDEGTEVIKEYFGKTVFTFNLAQAIEHRFLTPYIYFPHFVELTPEELKEYKDYQKRIAMVLSKKDSQTKDKLNLLLIKRKKIITNAKEKYILLQEILGVLDTIERCLIYCSPQQIKNVQDYLASNNIIYHRFTSKENIKQREIIKKNFADRKYAVLVAMKCLDEGVDIPSTELGIIMASSGNPKEYIQRRGRLLRKFPGKTKAIIHDILVIPQLELSADKKVLELERNIIRHELVRYQEFANSSLNPLHATKQIMKIQDQYKLY